MRARQLTSCVPLSCPSAARWDNTAPLSIVAWRRRPLLHVPIPVGISGIITPVEIVIFLLFIIGNKEGFGNRLASRNDNFETLLSPVLPFFDPRKRLGCTDRRRLLSSIRALSLGWRGTVHCQWVRRGLDKACPGHPVREVRCRSMRIDRGRGALSVGSMGRRLRLARCLHIRGGLSRVSATRARRSVCHLAQGARAQGSLQIGPHACFVGVLSCLCLAGGLLIGLCKCVLDVFVQESGRGWRGSSVGGR